MSHIFTGSCEVIGDEAEALRVAEISAFENSLPYIRGKEFKWFKFISGVQNKGADTKEAVCTLEFSLKI